MEPIYYWYPVVYLDDEDPEDCVVVQQQGKILRYSLDCEPYEATVESGGYSYRLIFGSHRTGMFLCIPDWNVGCELSGLSNRDWNMESLLRTELLDYEGSTAIVWALSSISSLLQLIH